MGAEMVLSRCKSVVLGLGVFWMAFPVACGGKGGEASDITTGGGADPSGDGDETGQGKGDGDETGQGKGDGDGDTGAPLPETCKEDSDCDDGRFCTGVETCDEGRCAPGDVVDCDDGIACTKDSCSESDEACVFTPPDEDEDGFADASCEDAAGNALGSDCDDLDPGRYPGNVEICDDNDEDCDDTTFGYADEDGDGEVSGLCCNGDNCGSDCDDTTIYKRSGQVEICDGVDNDCDGEVDNNTQQVPWYEDKDGDLFGSTVVSAMSCYVVIGASLLDTDCDDTVASTNPSALERCGKSDENCNGEVDEDLDCSGSPSCEVENGYCGEESVVTCDDTKSGEPVSCEDVDECAVNNGGCGDEDQYECFNVFGASPICDIDECSVDNGGCGTPALYACVNRIGAAPVCDLDECLTNNGGCGDPAYFTCTNQVDDVPICEDIDECETDNGGCGDAAMFTCTNNVGAAPTCDENECATNNGGCGDPAFIECVDSIGGFECEDITECDVENGGCGDPSLVVCVENKGAAPTCAVNECATNNGGCGDPDYIDCIDSVVGFDCVDINECEVNNGSCGEPAYVDCVDQYAAAHECKDINECESNNGGCGSPSYYQCTNNYGAAHECSDIDECETNNGGCGAENLWHCTNNVGTSPTCSDKWQAIDTEDGLSCAQNADGSLHCDGYDYSDAGPDVDAAAATDIKQFVVSAGGAFTISSTGKLTAYGDNGGSGIGSRYNAINALSVSDFTQVDAYWYRMCALHEGGDLSCWDDATETAIATGVESFSVGKHHRCVIYSADHTIECFGTDTDGCVSGPNADPSTNFSRVTTGNGSTCALKSDGTIHCWGPDSSFINDTNANLDYDYVDIDMGNDHVCALHTDDTLSCFGADDNSRITNAEAEPVVTDFSVGDSGICVIRPNGSGQCFGTSAYGYLALNPILSIP